MSPTRLPRWSAVTGRWPLVFPVLLFPPVLVRPSKYLEPYPRPRERPGNTRAGRPLARWRVPGRMGIPGNLVWQGWGLWSPGSRGQIAVFCTIVAVLREEWDSVLARWTARARHPQMLQELLKKELG